MNSITHSTYYKNILHHTTNTNHTTNTTNTTNTASRHLHYRDTTALDEVAEWLGVTSSSTTEPFYLLDVGSGFGESARYLANKHPNLHIDCVERHPQLHRRAKQFTAREPTDVQKRIKHICVDILAFLHTTTQHKTKTRTRSRGQVAGRTARQSSVKATKTHEPKQKYHGVLCMMTLLHLSLPDCRKVLGGCARHLLPMGRIVTEDFFRASTKQIQQPVTPVTKELCHLFGICQPRTAQRTYPQFSAMAQRVRTLQRTAHEDLTVQCKQFVQHRANTAPSTPMQDTYQRISTLFTHNQLEVWRTAFQLNAVETLPVPRALFLPEHQRRLCALDRPVPIDYGQTISAPHIHQMTLGAFQRVLELEQVSVTRATVLELNILDVGCGSGYVVAMLCDAVDKWIRTLVRPPVRVNVVGIDIVPELVAFSQANVHRWAHQRRPRLHKSIHWLCTESDGWQGYAKYQPYTFINVGAMAETLPRALVQQLAPVGRLLVPVNGDYVQYDQRDGHSRSHVLTRVRFVPLVNTTNDKMQNAVQTSTKYYKPNR